MESGLMYHSAGHNRILYARGEFVEVIDSLDYVPGEVKEYIEAAKKYYRPVRVDKE